MRSILPSPQRVSKSGPDGNPRQDVALENETAPTTADQEWPTEVGAA
nr:hypothetical protein HMPREF0276_1147 [Corynebacterium accolens ATCC 49725]